MGLLDKHLYGDFPGESDKAGLLGILPPSVLERIKVGALLPAPAVPQAAPARMPNVTPQAASVQTPAPTYDAITGVDRDALLQAIIKRETRGEKDPFIFTRVDGESKDPVENLKEARIKARKAKLSSAFGPAQINYTLAGDVLKHNKNLDDDFKEYLKDFILDGKTRIRMFKDNHQWPLDISDRENYEKYMGGGKGTVTQDRHDKYYNRLTQLALDEKLKILKEQGKDPTVENIAGAWYGGTAEKTKNYTDGVGEYYKENVRPAQALAKTGPRSTAYAPGLLN